MMRLTFLPIILIATPLYSIAETTEEPDSAQHELKEVIVVAQENKGITSSSRIDRSAMQHLQPTSFADLLELLPGNISQDPNMGKANTINLRETGTLTATGGKSSNAQYAITSLGTQFMVDGAPMNTDANLQGIPGGDATDPAGRRSTVNSGVDMRTISTDNIESVEIVRGIPSAEYGNLTSGLVNIRRIKRSTPLTLRFKADGYSKLFSASKGITLSPQRTHTLNLNLSCLDSKSDPRNSLENYKRINALVLPTLRFESDAIGVNWSIGLDYTRSFDKAKLDPDLNFQKIDEYRSDYNRYASSTDLNLTLYDNAWIDNVVLNASISYESNELTRRKQVAPSRASIAPSGMDEGAHYASLLLSEYIADYRIDGCPLTANIKAKTNGSANLWGIDNGYKAGIEWAYSKNLGDGEVYYLGRPLSGGWSTRPRAFKDIPATQLLSLFAEDGINKELQGNKLEAQIGVRLMTMPALDKDYYLSKRIYADPRINLLWRFPEIDAGKPLRLLVATGWGKTTKMPTLDYLYPQVHYNDIVQLNYYDTSNPAEGSRVNVLTYKVDVTNHQLRAATNKKWEVRIGASWGQNQLDVTYFDERMNDGFRYTPIYNAYSYKKYDAAAYASGSGSLDDTPYQEARILDGFSMPTNGTRIYKRGVEYTLQSQRIMPLRTSLIINGAWLRTTYSNSQALYTPVNDVVGTQAVSDLYVGLYDSKEGRVNEQFNTNFMLDTQIPEWNLIFTTSVQCMWYVKTTRLRENGVPIAYISAYDAHGPNLWNLHPYDDEAMDDPMLKYLVRTYNEDAFRTVKVPTAVYINLKVSKQIGQWLRLSAFVNRIIDYLPDYKSNGLTVRRNSDAYFGMEAVISI